MRSRRTPRIVVALPGRTRENSFFFSRMWAGCRQQFEDLAAYHLDVVEAPFDDTQEDVYKRQVLFLALQLPAHSCAHFRIALFYKSDGIHHIRVHLQNPSLFRPYCCLLYTSRCV